jgi:putative oxidoreductase
MIRRWVVATRLLDTAGDWAGFMGLRLLLGWEFFESGMEKYQGENWFADIQAKFPLPFNLLPVNISWSMATWFELMGGVALVIGLGTRFFAASLFVLTVVATAAVHWPAEWHTLAELVKGYAITDDGFGNFKLPLLFLAMLLPLILHGPGKLSLDAWIARRYRAHA